MNLLLEHSQSVGIGQHQRGDIFIHLRRQCRNVHHALRIRFQILHGVIHHSRRCRIRTVRRIGDQNFLSRPSLRVVIGANHEQSRHLAVRTGGGLQCNRVHASDLNQALAQRFQNPQRTLRNLFRLVGMAVGNSLDPRHRFIHTRVIFHRA